MGSERAAGLCGLLGVVLLAGCAAPVDQTPALPDPETDSCFANRYGSLIGQDATALEKVLLLGQVRVIRPGMAVSMEYRAERINFEVGPMGQIIRIYCG